MACTQELREEMSALLIGAARLGLVDKIRATLASVCPSECPQVQVNRPDETGRTALHYAAVGTSEECVELLLESGSDPQLQDKAGDTPLHLAAQAGLPMPSYQLSAKGCAACLAVNERGQTPVDVAVVGERGEVLNAMLLACSGQRCPEALQAMAALLSRGAVCDTWAPNGSSALQLAAAADCGDGTALLLGGGASLELQDALGRTAAMFAAGNDALAALTTLLDAGASVSIRDRRGRSVMDYAPAGSAARALLAERMAALELKAAAMQEALLAELLGDGPACAGAGSRKSKKKAKAKAKKAAAAALAVVPTSGEEAVQEEAAVHKQQQQQQPETSASSEPAPEAAAPLAPEVEGPKAEASSSSSDGGQGWQTVGKAAKHGQQEQGRPPASAPVAAPPGMRRCPSATSLVSACSDESHETDTSRYSGSERSVLGRCIAGGGSWGADKALVAAHHSRVAAQQLQQSAAAAARHLPQQAPLAAPLRIPALAGGGAPAWRKLPAAAVAAWSSEAPRLPPSVDEAAFPPLGVTPMASEAEARRSAGAKLTAAAEHLLPQPQQQASAAGSDPQPGEAQPAAAPAPAPSPTPAAAPARPTASAVAAAEAAARCAEVTSLRSQLAALRQHAAALEVRQQQELAAVLEDASRHETHAVQQAVAAERMNCILRFASFLQNNGLAMLGASPELMMGGGTLPGLGSGTATAAPNGLRGAAQQHAAAAAMPMPSIGAKLNSEASSPPAGLDSGFPSFSFPPPSSAGAHFSGAGFGKAQVVFGGGGGEDQASSIFATSPPLAAAPFSFQGMESHLRGEFRGDHSTFVVPASAPRPAGSGASLLGEDPSLLGFNLGASF